MIAYNQSQTFELTRRPSRLPNAFGTRNARGLLAGLPFAVAAAENFARQAANLLPCEKVGTTKGRSQSATSAAGELKENSSTFCSVGPNPLRSGLAGQDMTIKVKFSQCIGDYQ